MSQTQRNSIQWKRIDKARENFIQRFSVRIRIAINRSGRDLRNAIDNAGSVEEITSALNNTPFQKEALTSELEKLYKIVGSYFLETLIEDLKAGGLDMHLKRFTEVSNEALVMDIVAFIQSEGAAKVTRITENMRAIIQTELEKGVNKGHGIEKIKRSLRARWQTLSHSRGRTIARTEVMTASSTASDLGAQRVIEDTGLTLRKIWLATPIGKYRLNHLEIDGKGVHFNDSFNVGGGVYMKHPHDPSAPPGEVINCRCSIRYAPLRSGTPVDAPLEVNPLEWTDVKTVNEAAQQLRQKYKIDNIKMVRSTLPEHANTLGRGFSQVFNATEKLRKTTPPRMDHLVLKGLRDEYGGLHKTRISRKTGEVLSTEMQINNKSFNAEFRQRFNKPEATKDSLTVGKNLNWSVGGDVASTVRHEYGHHIWETYLTRKEKHRFLTDLWYKGGKQRFKNGVSRYSAFDEYEAFAESFSAYTSPLYGKDQNTLPKEIHSFFVDIFGKRN